MGIDNIVFHRDGDLIKTIVFFDDGMISNLSYEEGVKLLLQYANDMGYKKISELKDDEHIKIWDKQTYQENIYHLFTNSIAKSKNNKYKSNQSNYNTNSSNDGLGNNDTDDDENDNSMDEGIESGNKHGRLKRFIKRVFKRRKKSKIEIFLSCLIGIVVTAIVGEVAWIVNDVNKKQQNIEKDKKQQSLEKDNHSNDKNSGKGSKKAKDVYSFLSADKKINADKSKAINSIWGYIHEYNLTFANHHISKKSETKLGLRWNEVVAEYLAYNRLSQQSINNIFDTYKFDSDTFINAYKSGFNQEVLAHVVQKESSGKSNLLMTEKGKKFYDKYESILIYYNTTKEGNQKKKYAEEFYQKLRKDFDFDQENIGDVEKYKLSIMSMVEAMNKMTSKLDLSNKLSTVEKSYFNELSDVSMIKQKFEKIEKKLSSYQIATKTLKENKGSKEISYKELKNQTIKELKKDDIYNVFSNSDRNIKDHSEYKKNISYKYNANDITNNENNNDDKKDVISSDVSSKKDQSSSTTKTTKNEDAKNTTKATTKKKKVTKSKNTAESSIDNKVNKNNESSSDISDNKDIDDGSGEVISDNTGAVDISDSSDDKNITPDVSQDNNDISDVGNIETDDSIKDITSDSTGAVDSDEPLPDPNEDENDITNSTSLDNSGDSDSLITITYVNPDSLDASSNYQVSEDNEMTEESVATQNTSDEISSDDSVKTYTR